MGKQIRQEPTFRPCAVCGQPKNSNAAFWFKGVEIRVICTPCWSAGYTFQEDGTPVIIDRLALRRQWQKT